MIKAKRGNKLKCIATFGQSLTIGHVYDTECTSMGQPVVRDDNGELRVMNPLQFEKANS